MSNYRKIWEDVNGPIPLDSNGRKMEIHHIDGNRTNNSLDNFQLLSIDEHYEIHYTQGDWAACQSIANRMKISPEEKSKRCSELAQKRVVEGTHHFQNPEFIKKDSERKSKNRRGENHPLYGKKMPKETTEKQSVSQKKLVEQGIHHLQQQTHKDRMRKKSELQLQNRTHNFQLETTRKKIKNTHNTLLDQKKHPFNSLNRIDPNKLKVWCKVCNKETTLPAFNRFHKH
jgi:hypothetical protein